MKKVLLYSGGMDSWLISQLWNPDILLYVNLHTQYSENEIERLPKEVIVEDLNLSKWERDDKIIPLRNLYLVALATNYGDEICLGATAGDRVLDKSYEFADMTSKLLSFLYSKQHWTKEREIKISLPYKSKSKHEILNMYLEKDTSLSYDVKLIKAWTQSFSCYVPHNNEPCFSCKPCFRKAVAFYKCMQEHNVSPTIIFSKKNMQTLYNYIKNNIIQDALAGKTGRGQKEELDIIDFYNYLQKQI